MSFWVFLSETERNENRRTDQPLRRASECVQTETRSGFKLTFSGQMPRASQRDIGSIGGGHVKINGAGNVLKEKGRPIGTALSF